MFLESKVAAHTGKHHYYTNSTCNRMSPCLDQVRYVGGAAGLRGRCWEGSQYAHNCNFIYTQTI